MGTMITTPEGMKAFHLLQMYYALKIQATTGLRHSQGSVINLVKSEFPEIEGRTAKTVLREYGEILKKKGILRDGS